MQQGGWQSKFQGSLIPWIIGVNIALSILTVVVFLTTGNNWVQHLLSLRSDAILEGRWWEFFTYMWVHAFPLGMGFLHIAFNMLTLWMFGGEVERTLGKLGFAGLYLLSGLAAAGAFFLEFWIRSGFSIVLLAMQHHTVIGASGAVIGVVAAYSVLIPSTKVYLFLIPYPIKIKHAMIGFIILSVVMMFIPSLAFIGHSAHIGGALTGYAWMWAWKRFRQPTHGTGYLNEADLKHEVYRITRKASEEGVQALSADEVEVLRQARWRFFGR